jgi:hypothetical protein
VAAARRGRAPAVCRRAVLRSGPRGRRSASRQGGGPWGSTAASTPASARRARRPRPRSAAAGLKSRILIFSEADHAFFNDTGARFNAPATAEAFGRRCAGSGASWPAGGRTTDRDGAWELSARRSRDETVRFGR